MSIIDPANQDQSLSSSARDTLEARYTFGRIVELEIDPVRGNFDSEHLCEVHRRIFQDLPLVGCKDVMPGQYRPAALGADWMKNRVLSTVTGSFFVAYSDMHEAAQQRLATLLSESKPIHLNKLATDEFVTHMAQLYTAVDYIHPFHDGNSRTLRTFTKQLAQKCGYDLDWSRFNGDEASRDALYIARDTGVNRLAMPHLQREQTMMKIARSLTHLQGRDDLRTLLNGAIQRRILSFPSP